MKKIIGLLLGCILLLSLCACQTENGGTASDEVAFEYVQVSGGLEITGFSGESKKIVIPETIDGKVVVSVGTTFSGNTMIEEIELPNTVTEADLSNCTALKRLNAKGITVTTKLKLKGCESLEYLSLPALTSAQRFYLTCDVSSVRELVLTGIKEIHFYELAEFSSLETLDISSATLVRRDYYSWPSTLKEVKISDSIDAYYIADETGTVGGVFARERDFTKDGDITVENADRVWCEFFNCEEITVNGVTYQ